MSGPTKIIMPGDGAPSPYTIPGTGRKYACAAGSAITVVADDADILLSNGYVTAHSHRAIGGRAGTTANRPSPVTQGHVYNDTTVGAMIVYGGPVTGWLHGTTGASV